jgi:hypothetical protein
VDVRSLFAMFLVVLAPPGAAKESFAGLKVHR